MQIFALSWLLCSVFLLSRGNLAHPAVWCAALLLMVAAARYRRTLAPVVAGCLIAIVALLLAFFQLQTHQLSDADLLVDTRLRVMVDSVPDTAKGRIRFNARVLECVSCVSRFGPERLQLSWYRARQTPRAGEVWDLTVRLRPMSGLQNPGGFDRIRWSVANGLHARGYIKDSPVATRVHAASPFNTNALRETLAMALDELPASEPAVGFVKALILGIKHEIDADHWAVLRDTGTAHLVAISGLHVGLIAGWALMLGRVVLAALLIVLPASSPWQRYIDPNQLALLFSLLAATGYAFIAGFELPVQRAILMLSVWVIAAWRFRLLASTTGLAVALCVVLGSNVFQVLSAGFWLSFGTVAALFYLHRGHIRATALSPESAEQSPRWKRMLYQLLPTIRTHVLLGLCLLPVTAWFFQSGSLIAPVANLLAVPWVGFVVVPLCFASVLLAVCLPSVANLCLILAQRSLDWLLEGLGWLTTVSSASLTLSLPTTSVLICSLLGLLLLLAPRGIGLRRFGLVLVLPAIAFNVTRPAVEGFDVHVLDVGQGLAALVFTDNHTLLYDTGGKVSSSLSMFEAVVIPFLHAKGRRTIDTLVVSHPDEDHAFGVADVLKRFPDVRLLSSTPLPAAQETAIQPCVAGDVFVHDAVQFSVLHPAARDTGSKNDRSCVLLIHHGAARVLLTGDIEGAAERRLASRLGPFPVDVMTAPHHGSNSSSSDELLALLAPLHVVFPAGYRNKYGFPHHEVQLRYTLAGASSYITGTQGAVSFFFDRNGLRDKPVTWWQSHRRFWHGFVNPACSQSNDEQAFVWRQFALLLKGQSLCGK